MNIVVMGEISRKNINMIENSFRKKSQYIKLQVSIFRHFFLLCINQNIINDFC